MLLGDDFGLFWTLADPNPVTTYNIRVGRCHQGGEECSFSEVLSGHNETQYLLDSTVCSYACSVERCVIEVISFDPDLAGSSSSLNLSISAESKGKGEG